MHQAIETHYLPATNTKGARVAAVSASGIRHVRVWDWELGQEANHARAASGLVAQLGWNGEWVGGATQRGFCFVDLKGSDHGFRAGDDA